MSAQPDPATVTGPGNASDPETQPEQDSPVQPSSASPAEQADAPAAAETSEAPDTPDTPDHPEAADSETEIDLGYRRWDCVGGDPEVVSRAEDDARAAIEAGECIVLPTDTVYGIGADAFNGEAVQRLLDAKVRGRDMPPPVLIGEPSLIRALATDIPDAARELVARHWPGPLTIILKRQPSLKMDLGETEGTVALRVPDHELARDILRATGPMAVSSANISGLPAALSCDDAIAQLGANVSVYLDGGRVGEDGQAASTIVDFTQADHGQVLRRGALSLAVLRETLPDLEDLVDDGQEDEPVDAGDEVADGEADAVGQDAVDPDTDANDQDAVDSDADGTEPVDESPVSAEDIREQIEGLSEPAGEDPEPPTATSQAAEVWHEPTTDELRITHPDHDIDQPDLFEADRPTDDARATPDPRV